jgi:ribosomal protein S18 acetylase RimI-like enzyme
VRAEPIEFRTIDLPRHADTAVAFRRDSYLCSFGSDAAFGQPQEYLAWLGERIASHPGGHVHVWEGSRIIGQLEMLTHPTTPVSGYVNLFYLVAEARGRGFGDLLHRYAVEHMQARGARLVRLSVSPSNARAWAYYRKHAWRDCGLRPGDDTVHVLELDLG